MEADGLASFVPRPWIGTDGSFTVFIESFGRILTVPTALSYGRRYSSSGEPLTPLVKGDEVEDLPGYQDVVETLTYEYMVVLEYDLREYLTHDVMEFRFCSKSKSGHVFLAQRLKSLTRDARQRAFFTAFFQQRLTHCGRLEYNGEVHDRCASEDNRE